MRPKPAHLSGRYASAFLEPDVARAYRCRPPYPDEVFALLGSLLGPPPSRVLELGCGPGEISRRLAPVVERIDAVDASEAMLEQARSLPGGGDPRIHWHQARAEEFALECDYALMLAAESLHWMDWPKLLPRLGAALAPGGKLVVLHDRRERAAPWLEAVRPIFARFSLNRDYRPYDLFDELALRGLYRVERRLETRPVSFQQSVADYVECQHSRAGFPRARMGAEAAAAFDAELRGCVEPYAHDGLLEFEVVVDLAIGVPT